jgi:16S rRNA C967 or C1407 C5-methylase (RsmB/RsmF family)
MPVHLPHNFLNSLEGIESFDKDAFVQVHELAEQVTSVRVNPFKATMVNDQWSIFHHSQLTIDSKISWTETGFYLESRPSFTFDPLFHAGCYYVQEASSMFLEQVIRQTVDLSPPLKVLDLCAAPGGKSTHLLSLISKDSLLVSNEVIRSRANILNDNIV